MKKIRKVTAALCGCLLLASCSSTTDASSASVSEYVKEEVKLEDVYNQVDQEALTALLEHGIGIVFLTDGYDETFLRSYAETLDRSGMTASLFCIDEENRSDSDILAVLEKSGIQEESIPAPRILFVNQGELIAQIEDADQLTAFEIYTEQILLLQAGNEKDACDAEKACTFGE